MSIARIKYRVFCFSGVLSVCLYYTLALTTMLKCSTAITDVIGYFTGVMTVLGICLLYSYQRVIARHTLFWLFGCILLCGVIAIFG